MKKFIFPVLIITLLFFSLCFTSCNDTENYKYYLVPVDSLSIPDNVYAGETFEVKLFGTIGHDGCSSFERFITEKKDTILMVEAWGKSKTNTYICPQVEVELEREKVKCRLDEGGTYILKVKQPDGSFFERQFIVQ